MSVLDSYMIDLAELVNKDRGTANIAGVTEAAKIMKGHLESIGFKADLVELRSECRQRSVRYEQA